ncbi:PREDICTED: ataxin-3-like isoform X1 [Acropora digitifera]|uniref:ataxin-3-like isoform X1 n=1 Tax=Acropora digitifera TaxID=70779 RepID=UPI00077A926E|nr:PREDICTED: ataxin-3-like isoform X1 [Acropora digitifera]
MEFIFHEKQEGSLCAQHCLNALLQGPYFTAVDLADIARQLDEDERERMAEGDMTSKDYQEFLQQPSSNMDDSGFFSIQIFVHSLILEGEWTCMITSKQDNQCTPKAPFTCVVICNALRLWNIKLVAFPSPEAKEARENPQNQRAFICNLQQHWLTIRKLGHQWFNLNSLLAKPELITETYLLLYLTQLQTDGYSIFVVMGRLPESKADQMLKMCPAQLVKKPANKNTFQKSISKSDLTAALQQATVGGRDKPADMEEIRRRRELYFTRQQQNQENDTTRGQSAVRTDSSQIAGGPDMSVAASSQGTSDLLDEEILEIALQLSLVNQ